MNTLEVKPFPIVWHVSPRFNDFHIALHGILLGKDNYVYANNHSHSLCRMWPLPIDSWDYSNITNDEFIELYTFWRIDTQLIENKWEIDLNMLPEIKHDLYDLLSKTNYIRTNAAIPPHAILPFYYSRLLESEVSISQQPGSASISPMTHGLPLLLNEEIVNWIAWRNEADREGLRSDSM
jgi:hypothetical protein